MNVKSRKKKFFICALVNWAILTNAFFIFPQAGSSAYADSQAPGQEEREITANDLLNAVRAGRPQNVDTRAKIVNLLKDVKDNKITPEDFYQKVSELPMPPGMELRHVLMEVKKDIGNYLGTEGLKSVFGEIYDSGATRVEAVILSHRKKMVMDTIKEAIVIYREQVKAKTGEYPHNTFYYGEVGGWPNESFEELKFAGDIDFNFLSGDLDAAMELKKIFDGLIKGRYKGRSPEELDIPCTVHGMATAEVYVGKYGQTFAEAVTKVAWEIDFENAGPDMDLKARPVAFKMALEQMVLEAKVDEVANALPDLKSGKWPHQPGISLEMIRHFEHDIAGKDVFTNLESFVKAAKYAERAYSFLIKELGDQATFDPDLKKFVEKLTKWKKDPKAQVAFIKLYFEKIGKPLPFEVNLEINEDGKGRATIEANQNVIETFWDICRKAMWDGANQVIKKKTADLRARVNALGKDNIEESKKIYEELVKLDEMMEIENLVLHDEVAGVHGKIDPDFDKLMGEFRAMRNEYKKKSAEFGHVQYIDPQLGKSYKWVETMLKMGKPESIKWALAGIMSLPGRANDYLDFLDDGLMTKIRQGEGDDYIKILRKGQGLYWEERANKFLAGTPFEGRFDAQFRSMEAEYNKAFKDIEIKINENYSRVLNSRGLKAVQGINTAFNESVQSSAVGRGMMTGMMLVSLKDELPAYWEKMMNDDYEGLAAEFFKRRIPFGGAVERGVMGDYYGVAWELTSTLIPPAAIFSAAASVGEYVATTGFETYFDEELEVFIDNLYDGAEFKIAGVEKVGEDIKISNWELLSVSHGSTKFNYDELIELETSDASEMAACLRKPSDQRSECFPMEKRGNGLFEWWRNADAFEHQFRKTDPWIQMINEMEKDPHAGPKLKEHFRYQKWMRLEHIKVDFLKRTKIKLEERRAAEQALLSGQMVKMYGELIKIIDELDIRLQVNEALAEKFGNSAVMLLTWMKDFLRGAVREIRGDVDIWEQQEELSSWITKNLSVYAKIHEGRAQAEQGLLLSREDQGLRLLTGPYFLRGKSDEDSASSEKWIELPAKVNSTVTEKLSAIKKEAKADPVELDLSDESYDRKTLDQLVYHDSFREMWKQVNSAFTDVKIPSFLGKSPAKQAAPNDGGVMSDQDRALERFTLHARRADEILEEFRKYYESRKTQQPEGEASGQGSRAIVLASLEALLAKIEALEVQAEEVSGGIVGAAKSLEKELKAEQDALQRLLAEVNGLSATLIAQYPNVEKINGEERFIYGLGETLGRLRSSIENATLSTCEIYDRVKATDRVNELDKLIGEARTHYSSEQQYYGEYQGMAPQMDAAKGRVEGERGKSGNSERILSQYDGELSDAQGRLDAARAQLANIENMSAALAGFVGEADNITREALSVSDEVMREDATELSKNDKKTMKQVERILEKIKKSQVSIIKAQGKAGSKKDTLASSVSTVDGLLTQIRSILDGHKQSFAGETFKQQLQQALNEFQATSEAAELFVEPIVAADKNARICMDGIQSQYDRKTTPEARVAQTDCSQWPGSFAKWDYTNNRAQCECPSGQVWVDARNSCYDRVAAAVESLNCSGYPNSEPRWDEGQQRALCFCVSGYEWSADNSRCIVDRRTQVAQTNCSMYGPSEAYWDNGRDQVLCGCRQGYEWNSNMTYCVQSRESQVAQTNCSGYGPGAYAYWDNNRNQPLCACGNGYQWNVNSTYCEQLPRYDAGDFARDMGNIINTIQGAQGGSGAGYGSGTTTPPTQAYDPCEQNVSWNGNEMACLCSGYKYDYGWVKCVRSASGSGPSGGGSIGPGGGGGGKCCSDGSQSLYGTICPDGNAPIYPCSGGSYSGSSSGGGTSRGSSGGAGHVGDCCANGMPEFLGQGVCIDGSPVVGPCQN